MHVYHTFQSLAGTEDDDVGVLEVQFPSRFLALKLPFLPLNNVY